MSRTYLTPKTDTPYSKYITHIIVIIYIIPTVGQTIIAYNNALFLTQSLH